MTAAWAGAVLRARGDAGPVTARRTPTGAEVYTGASLVLKVHRRGTDDTALRARLRAAARLEAFLGPVGDELLRTPVGRSATLWPRGQPVSQDEVPPWWQAGALVAALHRAEPPPGLPAADPARRLRSLLAALPRTRDGDALQAAAATVPAPRRPAVVVHGDWHLGQLARTAAGPLRLVDVDELGLGDPADDLARPAGLRAAGLMGDGEWEAFLDGYRSARGPALPAGGDPWGALDGPARRAVVVLGARALLAGDGDALAVLLEACRGMTRSIP